MNGFPHLNEEEYIRVLRQKISTRQALILKDGGTAIGIMLFSYENGSLKSGTESWNMPLKALPMCRMMFCRGS